MNIVAEVPLFEECRGRRRLVFGEVGELERPMHCPDTGQTWLPSRSPRLHVTFGTAMGLGGPGVPSSLYQM